jgi:hypothetical protein
LSAPLFDELLDRLVQADVRFVVIGGLALGSWGVVRGTKDCDIVPDPAPENLDMLAHVAVGLGGHVQLGESPLGSVTSSTWTISARLNRTRTEADEPVALAWGPVCRAYSSSLGHQY